MNHTTNIDLERCNIKNSVIAIPWPEEEQKRYERDGVWENQSLFSYFEKSVKRFPERNVIVHPEEVSYRELMLQVLRLAWTLQQQGINSQSVVVLQLPNSPAFVQYLLACLAIGAVPVMALPAHRSRELNHQLKSSNAKAFIALRSADGNLGGFKRDEKIDFTGELIIVDSPAFKIYANDHPTAEIYRPSPNAVALLQLSGGTTGLPKLIPRTHNDYAYSIRKSNEICEVNERSVFLCLLPASHNFTLSSPGVLGTLFAGGALVLANQLSAEEAFKCIDANRVTHVSLVPPIALNWLHYFRMNPTKVPPLSGLTSLLVGGAKLNASSAQALINDLGAPLQQVFGMAEGLVNYTRLNDDDTVRCTTQGKPMSPYDQVLVVDDLDIPVKPGVVGHLLTKGPYTIRGYLNAAEHNRKAFTPAGFYRTGDLVSLDEQGNICVEGREKDQINRGGEKISAAELENDLLTHPLIQDAAVVAVRDDYLGEKVGVFLVLRRGAHINLPQCRVYLKQFGIADYKLPDKVFCVASLPKTPFGKINKNMLRAMANQIECA